MFAKSLISVAALAAVTGLAVSTASASITIPTVPIGNPGNAPDLTTRREVGSVAYTYNIGATEVTNAQYAAFLNAKAASDPFGLYSTVMASSAGGITRSGSAGSYTYSTVSGRANHPVNFVSFWDATRFANWLHNGQGSGDTETGAYTLNGITSISRDSSVARNAGWQWAVASEDEWYKAAYYQPASAGGDSDNYWFYPTQSNTRPTSAQANILQVVNTTTPVGSYAPNFYGTFDMAGNVWEWTDTIQPNGVRFLRGSSFGSTGSTASSAEDFAPFDLSGEASPFGFRVVQVPTPGAAAMLGLGGLLAARRRRR